jgi:uncharacterized protein DUF4352
MKNLIAAPAAALLICLVGCASSNDRGTEETENVAGSQESAQPLSRDVKFGETARAEYNYSQFDITVDLPKDYTEFAVPPEEGKYVAIDVEAKLIEGIGGAVTAASFTLVDAAGNEYTFAAPNGTDTKEQLFATLLSAGDSGSGIVIFDVPADPGNFVVEYIPAAETTDFASWS